MGLSSSQARLLHLTSRMHQIEYGAAKLEAQKLQMANESRRVYQEYQDALEATKIQQSFLSTDGSVLYKDTCYYDLCMGANSIAANSTGYHSSFYFDAGVGESSNSVGLQCGLFSTENGFMYVPKAVKDAYETSSTAEEFASKLSGWVPSTTPSEPDTPSKPSNPSVGGDDEGTTPSTPTNPPVDGDDNEGTTPSTPSNPSIGGDDEGTTPSTPSNPSVDGDDEGTTPSTPTNPSVDGDDNEGTTPSTPTNPSVGGDDNENTNPSDPSNPSVGGDNGDNTEEENYTIIRKSGSSVYIPSNKTEMVLCVKDDLLGDRYYKVTTGNESVEFRVLDSGRLLITGNGATITAYNGQKDDIIIKGDTNTIDTGDKDDIVRIGIVKDSLESYANLYNNNIINTGSGNDYVQNCGINKIDTGAENDTVLDYEDLLSNAASGGYIISDNGTKGYLSVNNKPVNCENLSTDIENNGVSNNAIEWGMQNAWGDCQSLSLINSIVNQGKYSEYFNIQKNGSSWNVTFKKSNITKTVTQNDLNCKTYTNGEYVVAAAQGDKDLALIEAALRLAVAADGCDLGDGSSGLGSSQNFDIVSKYICGQQIGGIDDFTETRITYAIKEYLAGNISNVVLGTSQIQSEGNSSLGIYAQHAYAVKSATFDNDGSIKSVTVINPHDNKDSITLDRSDFFKYFKSICLFGDTYTKYTNKYSNITYDAKYGTSNNSYYFYGSNDNYQYFVNLFHAINEAGGCEIVPDNMMYSTKYLTNIINGGFAYLKMYDNKTAKWVDTSVSTNTSLREVTDETGLRKAEAKYEADMNRIDRKDRKYDYDLAALENERNAIKQEMDTLKTVAKDNVERTFKLFS